MLMRCHDARQVTWLATHWAGCILYYIALQEGLSEHTWLQIKPDFVASLSSFERWAAPCALHALIAPRCHSCTTRNWQVLFVLHACVVW